jgi:hypothetical protein
MTDVDLINDLLAEASALDSLDIPDVEIEYLDRDDNNECESGACAI